MNRADGPATDVAGAETKLRQGALLLDVREPEEWSAGHAPQAEHVPLGDLSRDSVPAGREVVAVCRSGARSMKATRQLREWGVDAVNLDGGMQAWSQAGLPVVTDGGDSGEVA